MAQRSFPLPIAQPTGADTLPALGTATFIPIQARIPLAFTLPAIGGTVTVGITPISTPTALAFRSGDIVVVDQAVNGVTTQRATFVVNAAPIVNSIVLRFQPVAGDATAGTILAGSELTGQTRLPAIPSNATRAIVQTQASQALLTAEKTGANLLNPIAVYLRSGEPLAYLSFAAPGAPMTDLVTHTGLHLGETGFQEITNAIDLGYARLFCTTPMALAPVCTVIYR
jgi:hypothetical protein